MSHFGADIFDDEPPSEPPSRKPRKSAKAKAEAAPAEPAVPTAPEAPPEASKKRRNLRKKGAAEDASLATPAPTPIQPEQPSRAQRGEDFGDVVFPARSNQPTEPTQQPTVRQVAESQPQADADPAVGGESQPQHEGGNRDDRRRRRGRGRNRRERGEDAGQSARPEGDSPYGNPFAPTQPESDRPAARKEAPVERSADAGQPPEMDELGEGFGDIPHDDAEAEVRGASTEAGEPGRFPSFRDGGRRRRRRRGRRGRDDVPTDSREANPAAQFPKGQDEEVRPEPQARPFPQDAAAPRQPHWREDRPRREGHDRGRDDRHRNESFDRDEDRAPRLPRRPHSDFKPAPPPPQAPAARRIAILLDLAGLQREAQSLGAEVAFRKLRSSIAGHDEVVHAVCFAPHDLPETARKLLQSTGFTLEAADDEARVRDAIVQHATHGDWPVDAIVIAGAPTLLRRIARPEGTAIEAADFAGTDHSDEPARVLGRSCLFVP